MCHSTGKQKNLSDPPSLLCQVYADPPFLGRQKVNDPPLNSSGPPPLHKPEMHLSQSSNFKPVAAVATTVSLPRGRWEGTPI